MYFSRHPFASPWKEAKRNLSIPFLLSTQTDPVLVGGSVTIHPGCLTLALAYLIAAAESHSHEPPPCSSLFPVACRRRTLFLDLSDLAGVEDSQTDVIFRAEIVPDAR